MHLQLLSTLFLFISPLVAFDTLFSNDSAEERLAGRLKAEYTYLKNLVVAYQSPLHFLISFNPVLIVSLEERTQIFHTSAYFSIYWRDKRLIWEPSDYAGITEVHVSLRNLWRPDLIIENVVDTASFYIGSDSDIVKVSFQGDLNWHPTGSFRTVCKVNVVQFPFDTQRCTIHMTTWMSDSSKVNLTLSDPPVNYGSFLESGEWDLVGIEAYSTFTHEPEDLGNFYFESLMYTYHLKRRSTFYIVSILLPVLLLSLMNALVFMLPAETGERLSMSVTTMLSLTMFLSYIGDSTPENTQQVPHVAVFVLLNLVIGAVSTVFNILVLNVHFSRAAGDHDDDNNINSAAEEEKISEDLRPTNPDTASLCPAAEESARKLSLASGRTSGTPASTSDEQPAGAGDGAKPCVSKFIRLRITVSLLDKAFFTVMILSTCVGSLACFLAMLV